MSRLSVAVGSALRVYNSNGVLPASIRAESAGVYRIERALSEGASSLSAPRPRPAQAEPRAHAWLLLAQLCLRYAHARARTTHAPRTRTTHTRTHHAPRTRAPLTVIPRCRSGRASAAAGCVAEAAALTPFSHLVLYTVSFVALSSYIL